MGMVSKVFGADVLSERTLEFATRIAKVPSMAALLIKESVNQTQDAMGFTTALNACFTTNIVRRDHPEPLRNRSSVPLLARERVAPNQLRGNPR